MEVELEEFIKVFIIYFICNYFLVKVVFFGMCKEGYGCIINVIFIFVKVLLFGLGVSNIVCGVVGNWVKIFVNEVGVDGIIVNNIFFGVINIGCLQEIIEKKAFVIGKFVEDVMVVMQSSIFLQCFVEFGEIGVVIVFLVIFVVVYIIGVVLVVDGGCFKNM